MKKTIILLVIISLSTLCSGQVIKFKINILGIKFPEMETLQPDPWLTILDSNNKKCDYEINNGEFTVFHKPKTEEINLQINVSLREVKIKIKNFNENDTINLNPIFLVLDEIEILDIWYEFDDFKYYKKQYRDNKTEFSDDSLFYSIGKYKGIQFNSPEPYSFEFLENGIWNTYNAIGEKIVKVKYKNGSPDGQYELICNSHNLKAKGKFKNGKMTGEWTITHNNKTYKYSFIDGYLVYDVLKSESIR